MQHSHFPIQNYANYLACTSVMKRGWTCDVPVNATVWMRRTTENARLQKRDQT